MKKDILVIGSEGYVGSFLTSTFRERYNVIGVDNNLFDPPPPDFDCRIDYATLTPDFLRNFHSIILLAGYSSVAVSLATPTSVVKNNVLNFVNLLDKVTENQKIIYASSGSVITGPLADGQFAAKNWYDLSKHMIDEAALLSNKEIYGLRFGSVSGWSPTLRLDVLLNSMTYAALMTGKVDLYSPKSHRGVLGIQDLTKGVAAIIDSEFSARGIYDMASFNTTTGEAAKIVSRLLAVPVNLTDSNLASPYDFTIDSTRFCNTFRVQFTDTVESIVRELVDKLHLSKLIRRDQIVEYAK